MNKRLNGWPAICPMGIGSVVGAVLVAGALFLGASCALKPSGMAAEANSEDFTKPRRDRFGFTARAFSGSANSVKLPPRK
jgi:hypothetical protein